MRLVFRLGEGGGKHPDKIKLVRQIGERARFNLGTTYRHPVCQVVRV